MANKKIRIRLKAYEHRTLDTAAAKIASLSSKLGLRSSIFPSHLREK